MNILLFAPALLLAYLATQGLIGTIIQLAICGGLQVLLALPFLLENPVNYLKGAFNLGRIFVHKWTVNYRLVTSFSIIFTLFFYQIEPLKDGPPLILPSSIGRNS